jgi:xanthine dehydrogenase YagT iron-sulfur-binding subunit
MSPGSHIIIVSLEINGRDHELSVAACDTLLDVLRDKLGVTGTKKGCDMGACGACTVLADGRRIKSCLALAASYEGRSITTIEAIGTLDKLHPLQAAFIRHDALQCGYCTPGQIMSGLALLDERPKDLEAIREAMSGNLCRCGAHPNIVAAIAEVAGL